MKHLKFKRISLSSLHTKVETQNPHVVIASCNYTIHYLHDPLKFNNSKYTASLQVMIMSLAHEYFNIVQRLNTINGKQTSSDAPASFESSIDFPIEHRQLVKSVCNGP